MEVKWFPVKRYEGYYEISNSGEMRSVDRYDSQGRFYKGKTLKTREQDNEYRQGTYARLCKYGKTKELDIKYIAVNSMPKEELWWNNGDK